MTKEIKVRLSDSDIASMWDDGKFVGIELAKAACDAERDSRPHPRSSSEATLLAHLVAKMVVEEANEELRFGGLSEEERQSTEDQKARYQGYAEQASEMNRDRSRS